MELENFATDESAGNILLKEIERVKEPEKFIDLVHSTVSRFGRTIGKKQVMLFRKDGQMVDIRTGNRKFKDMDENGNPIEARSYSIQFQFLVEAALDKHRVINKDFDLAGKLNGLALKWSWLHPFGGGTRIFNCERFSSFCNLIDNGEAPKFTLFEWDPKIQKVIISKHGVDIGWGAYSGWEFSTDTEFNAGDFIKDKLTEPLKNSIVSTQYF